MCKWHGRLKAFATLQVAYFLYRSKVGQLKYSLMFRFKLETAAKFKYNILELGYVTLNF